MLGPLRVTDLLRQRLLLSVKRCSTLHRKRLVPDRSLKEAEVNQQAEIFQRQAQAFPARSCDKWPEVVPAPGPVKEPEKTSDALPITDRHIVPDEQWTDVRVSLSKLPSHCLALSKFRLTMLVCITSAAGFGMAPAEVFDLQALLVSTFGVGLISAAANSVNQFMEVPFDSQMNRTKSRVLVRGLLSPSHAALFACASGCAGSLLLWHCVNPLSAMLGLTNLVLYTCVYTPLKRVSISNTWFGSVVGAIPPLIGWASATGCLDLASVVLAGLLFSWQFPHFNSLSWNLRPDYSRAGYRMMSVTDPDLCKRVALRHSVSCLLLCSVAAPALHLTTVTFALDSLPLNVYLVYLAFLFYKKADAGSSRKLFRYTLLHLPILLTLMFVSRETKRSQPSDAM